MTKMNIKERDNDIEKCIKSESTEDEGKSRKREDLEEKR